MPKRFLFFVCLLLSLTASTQTYYIVRHGEKAVVEAGSNMMANDPPLSDAGKARAEKLKELLKTEKIAHIYSTNTIRTRTTAEPTSRHYNLTIETYGPRPDSGFINKVKGLNQNVLIVGHSNTVDDIVNMLLGEAKLSDLPDAEYDNLFVVTIKNGTATLERRKF
ncbi:MAG TPA: phosphoglycerate mutase family protein [Chitinophagaceae bacterium]|nr:phosphoglycerate mutase family protein [Chitinophagaceae bacterium]